ncbi:hypothetical protein I302_109044 [Kwoniella bestiolae CBS 10118]|uniref:Uncharacterized protein n=1 Tax=Kwoniella bestiolae CBS 10118 TaxID=1296100 RepID=A0A1B9FUV0_9TREE|nr:hypothetical protein I302_08188 [Kwoniella bestiolae CBS 10118]OCF22538.1 hypothetical protein I302_08188 [Kwoniella bestiolae CBS 10118]
MSTEQLQPQAPGLELDPIPQNDYVRPLQEDDERTVKTLIGLGIMAGLPRANNKIILNPLCILLILSLGYLLNKIMAFMPDENIISWFTALIGPCLASLPILGLVEYIQRPDFISLLRRTMGGLDLVKFSSYCDTSEGSKNSGGGWVFIHNDQVVGTILVDSQRAGEKLDTVLGAEEGEINDNKDLIPKEDEKEHNHKHNLRKRNIPSTSLSSAKKAQQRIIQIRHFAVDSPYNQSTIPLDLLMSALDHSFSTNPQSQDTKVIIKLQAFFNTDLLNSLKKIGFTKVVDKQIKGSNSELGLGLELEEPEKIGVLGWRGCWMVCGRSEYEAKKREVMQK